METLGVRFQEFNRRQQAVLAEREAQSEAGTTLALRLISRHLQ